MEGPGVKGKRSKRRTTSNVRDVASAGLKACGGLRDQVSTTRTVTVASEMLDRSRGGHSPTWKEEINCAAEARQPTFDVACVNVCCGTNTNHTPTRKRKHNCRARHSASDGSSTDANNTTS